MENHEIKERYKRLFCNVFAMLKNYNVVRKSDTL